MGLTLEAGKFYRTQDGRKAFVAFVLDTPMQEPTLFNHATGYVEEKNGRKWICHWAGNGACEHMRASIVAEWVDLPATKEQAEASLDALLKQPYFVDSLSMRGWLSPAKAEVMVRRIESAIEHIDNQAIAVRSDVGCVRNAISGIVKARAGGDARDDDFDFD